MMVGGREIRFLHSVRSWSAHSLHSTAISSAFHSCELLFYNCLLFCLPICFFVSIFFCELHFLGECSTLVRLSGIQCPNEMFGLCVCASIDASSRNGHVETRDSFRCVLSFLLLPFFSSSEQTIMWTLRAEQAPALYYHIKWIAASPHTPTHTNTHSMLVPPSVFVFLSLISILFFYIFRIDSSSAAQEPTESMWLCNRT